MALTSLGVGNAFLIAFGSVRQVRPKETHVQKLTAQTSCQQIITYFTSYAIYNLYFHPLARYPGPLLMRMTRLGYCLRLMRGTLPFDMLELHKKYGKVVRVAPNELAFQDSQAWKDIMGHKTGSALEFEKWDNFYRPVADMPIDIVNAPREEHGLIRRTMAHGFSDRNMRDQQPLIKKYLDTLLRKLKENGEGGKKALDIMAWYNFTTFDVIGDLAFGER